MDGRGIFMEYHQTVITHCRVKSPVRSFTTYVVVCELLSGISML